MNAYLLRLKFNHLKVWKLKSYKDTKLINFKKLKRFEDENFLKNFKVIALHSYRFKGLKGYRVTELQNCIVTKLQSCKVAKLQS